MNDNKNVVEIKKSFIDEIAEEAKKEILDEKKAKAKARLKELYRMKSNAEKQLKNIDNEIADYLIQLKDEV